MAGRNDPCPCGSGRKYKKCCERVIALQSAKRGREALDAKIKSALLTRMNTWFERNGGKEAQKKWVGSFKEALGLSAARPLPPHLHNTFRFWLFFDVPCIKGERPVEQFLKQGRIESEEQPWIREFTQLYLDCYEVIEVRTDEVLLRVLGKQDVYPTKAFHPASSGSLVFGRLSRLGNRYELFGPFTSFVSRMRGEIVMHLEKHQEESSRQKFWQQRGLNVLGWSMQRAQEIEKNEQPMLTARQGIEEEIRSKNLFLQPPSPFPLEATEQGLPPFVVEQLEQFYMQHVSSLQERTQALYRDSLQLFFDYISQYFGRSFIWSKLTEEVLAYFCGVWYIDQGGGNPIRAKIFLNTLKYLFRWLHQEGISDAYKFYKSVYSALIHTLPIAFEAKRWLRRSEMGEGKGHSSTLAGTFLWVLSHTGSALAVDGKCKPLHLQNSPPRWAEDSFWLRGTFGVDVTGCSILWIDKVYPKYSIGVGEPLAKNEVGG